MEFEWKEVLFCGVGRGLHITDRGGHCDEKIRGSTGARRAQMQRRPMPMQPAATPSWPISYHMDGVGRCRA